MSANEKVIPMAQLIQKHLAVVLAASVLLVLPAVMHGFSSSASLLGGAAYAKGGNGGGHGNGGSHGEGRGRGAGQGPGYGGGNTASNDHGPVGGDRKSAGKAGFMNTVFGFGDRSRGRAVESAERGKGRSLARQQIGLLRDKSVPVPSSPKDFRAENLHARLASLNSLKRNYHAYLNAQDPKFAAIGSYVMDYAQVQVSLEAAQDTLTNAQKALSSLTTYDGVAVDPTDPTAVQARLDTLNGLIETPDSTLTSEQQSQIDAEIGALTSVQEASETVETDQAALDAEEADTQTLTDALLSAANPNRVEEYGTAGYVDTETLSWAQNVLGVGEVYGKIDEVAASLASAPQDTTDQGTDTGAIVDTRGSQSV